MNAKKSPAMSRGGAALNALHGGGLHGQCIAPIDRLLDRLEMAHRCGKSWRARCPAHGSDRNQTLSIAAADDGRVLLHCFAGCTPLEILHSIGLELSDLFVKRITSDMTLAQRRELRELARQSQWRAALNGLMSEATVVLVAAGMVEKGEPLTGADDARLKLAIERIASAKAVFHDRL